MVILVKYHLIIILISVLLWPFLNALQPIIVPSKSALISSYEIASFGAVDNSGGYTLIYRTDFENIVKSSSTTLNMPISHEFGLGAVSNGARMWMEGLDENHGITPHSGSRCVGMETTTSERNEFNIYNIQNLAGQAYYISLWMYLPTGWNIPASHWYSLNAPLQGMDSPWLPAVEVHPNNWDNQLSIDLDSHISGGTWTTLDTVSGLPPIGEWFKFSYYVKLSTSQGIIRVWINDVEVLSASGVDTWGSVDRTMLTTVAKIYGPEGQGTWRFYVDDLSIYSAQ